MPLLDILTYPAPILRKKSHDVTNIDDTVITLLDNMSDTMYKAPGVGLAAPQIGLSIRVIVVDIDHDEEGNKNLIEIINPVITHAEGSIKSEEACLSLPGFTAEIHRKSQIVVEGVNRQGTPLTVEATDLLSRVLQHEIDHLDGILFIDRLSRLKRELMRKKVNKAFKDRY